jgi:uncharacterized caspase-like protein
MNVVFAIGCKRYSDPDVAQLKYADRDARRFVETVMGTQDPDNTEKYLLHDEHDVESFWPTRSNILRFLSLGGNRDKRTELDFLFFYFSGHGWSSHDGTDYLLTSDSIVTMPKDTAISVPMLERYLRNWEAKHVVLFIDACRTVMAGGKSITIQDESRIDVDSLCPPGMVTFCSCEPGQTSYEADPIHSGVFTEGVCKALGDEGRCSTIQELDAFLSDIVPRISDTYGLPRQIPYSRVEPLAVQRALIVSPRIRETWQTQEHEEEVQSSPETTQQEGPPGTYRVLVKFAWQGKQLSDNDIQKLSASASDLGLGADTTDDIEREVMGDTKEAILGRQGSTSREKEWHDGEALRVREQTERLKPRPLKAFCMYSHHDEHYLEVLKTWLIGLERDGIIEEWYDRMISARGEWEEAIAEYLETSDMVLLLVSPGVMGSQSIYEKEISQAVENHQQGKARVIPIMLRPSPPLTGTPLGKLQLLPKDGEPITNWGNQDQAWLDVLTGIHKAVQELLSRSEALEPKESSELIYHKAVEEAWTDGELHSRGVERLGDLASAYELSAASASAIEREVMGETKEAILERQELTSGTIRIRSRSIGAPANLGGGPLKLLAKLGGSLKLFLDGEEVGDLPINDGEIEIKAEAGTHSLRVRWLFMDRSSLLTVRVRRNQVVNLTCGVRTGMNPLKRGPFIEQSSARSPFVS